MGNRSDNGEQVVVKYLREYKAEHAVKCFRREIRILGRRLHGLVPLLAAGNHGERLYYVMPYFSKGPLTRYAGKLLPEQVAAVAKTLAMTIAQLHANGIAHGDIKPDNVFVANDGTIHVGDPLGNGFGCTVVFSQNKGGTPGYWAPEIKNGEPISRAGDVFSFGATIAHILTGQRPQDGQPFDQLASWYKNAQDLCELISVCCHADPSLRPTTSEILRMLNGERWADIEKSRKQVQDLFKFTGVLALSFLAFRALME